MLPKSRRLSRPNFIRAKKLGQTHHFPHFSIIIYRHPDPPPRLGGGSGEAGGGGTRYSVVTSSKLHKKAVIRNRLRRQIYNAVSNASCPVPSDFIIYPRASMLNLTRETLGLLLDSAISKITP